MSATGLTVASPSSEPPSFVKASMIKLRPLQTDDSCSHHKHETTLITGSCICMYILRRNTPLGLYYK